MDAGGSKTLRDANPLPVVQTVLGLVPAASLGSVLSHEHLLCFQPELSAYGYQTE